MEKYIELAKSLALLGATEVLVKTTYQHIADLHDAIEIFMQESSLTVESESWFAGNETDQVVFKAYGVRIMFTNIELPKFL